MENKKIKEIFADEALVKELLALETVAEFQAVLQKKGIEMIEADILASRDMLSKAKMAISTNTSTTPSCTYGHQASLMSIRLSP